MASVTPTTDIQKSLQTFRDTLKAKNRFDETRHDDALLLRFLKARKFDQEKTEVMFLAFEDWRVSFEVDKIVKEFGFPNAEKVAKIYPRFYHKTDKMGRPIYIERLGNLDVKAINEVTDADALVKKHVREFEKLVAYRFPACSAKAGKKVEQGCSILDLSGVPLSQFNSARKIIGSLSAIAQDYYPETMGRMFIINAPMLFTAIWAVIKGWLDESTVAKISVLGSNYLPTLLENIDAANLPDFLGGKSTCPSGSWENSDTGPWNDGSAAGFPIPFWEDMAKRDAETKRP